MPGRLALILVVPLLLLAACTDGNADELEDLERRVARLEARLATSTTSSTTTTTIDIEAIPPVALPTDQARTRLQRELPAPLTELWEAEWCLDHGDALETAAGDLGLQTPEAFGDPGRRREEAPNEFGSVCRRALETADPAPNRQDYETVVAGHVADATSQIVDEVAGDTSQLEAVLEDMASELRGFCGGNPELVYDAAFRMGRLPQGVSDDLETYWAVTRPHEYAAACREAYESR